MTPFIEKNKLNEALEELATKLNTTVAILKRAIYEDMQAEYDDSNVRQWFNDQGYVYNDNDVYAILDILREDYDSNMSCWENIKAAYNNAGLHLPYQDDVPEEKEEPSSCEVAFPNCQKCAHAGECEAYQHALQTMSELPAGSELAKLFSHNTDDCESFTPVANEPETAYTAEQINTDDLIFAIETDDNGNRQVHIYAYGYFAHSNEPKEYRFVEYTFFYVPLAEVLQKGIFDVEMEYSEFIKQYIEECTEAEMLNMYTHYDNGKCPTLITEEQLTETLPDGMYIVQYPREDA